MKLNNIFFYIDSPYTKDEQEINVTIDFIKTFNDVLKEEKIEFQKEILNLHSEENGKYLIIPKTKSLRKRVNSRKSEGSISEKWAQILQLTLLG